MTLFEGHILAYWVIYFLCVLSLRLFAPSPVFKGALLAVNIVACYFLFFSELPTNLAVATAAIVALSLFCYYIVLLAVQKIRRLYYVAILAPFISFALFRTHSDTFFLIGQAFLSIRLTYLAFEVGYRNQRFPTILEYLNYAFFLPTFPLGPITPFSQFHRDLNSNQKVSINFDLVNRFSYGLAKAFAVSFIFHKLTFDYMIFYVKHPWYEYLIAGIFFYIALYLKLSGIYDMIISSSAVIGFKVTENFNNPLLSRNLQDHWRRWHMSLLNYFREVFFLPMSVWAQRNLGKKYELPIVIALTFFIFTLIAIWHGLRWEYFYFGWLHALGVSAVIIYDRFLRMICGKKYENYVKSRVAYFFSWMITFIYIGMTYIFYEGPASFYHYLLKL